MHVRPHQHNTSHDKIPVGGVLVPSAPLTALSVSTLQAAYMQRPMPPAPQSLTTTDLHVELQAHHRAAHD